MIRYMPSNNNRLDTKQLKNNYADVIICDNRDSIKADTNNDKSNLKCKQDSSSLWLDVISF